MFFAQSPEWYHKAHSIGAVEYNDCTSAEEQDSLHECPVYDTKQSDG